MQEAFCTKEPVLQMSLPKDFTMPPENMTLKTFMTMSLLDVSLYNPYQNFNVYTLLVFLCIYPTRISRLGDQKKVRMKVVHGQIPDLTQ